MTQKPIIAMLADVAITAAEGDDTQHGPRRFDVTAYTGGELRVDGFDLPVVVDLAGLSTRNSLIANLDHDRSKRVGHVTLTHNDGKTLRLEGVASAATEARREVVDSSKDGFVWQASIEAAPTKLVKIQAGKKHTANGREFTGPIYVATKSTLKGFAFVSHGADDNTLVSIAAEAANSPTQRKTMKAEIKAWAESMGIDVENASDELKATIEANYEGRQAPPSRAKEAQTLEDILAAEKANRERVSQITQITATAIQANPDHIEAIEALARLAIDGKWDANRFELELLRASRPQAHTVFRPRNRDEKLTNSVIEAAVCQAGGLQGLERHFSEQTLEAADQRFRDGLGLQDLFLIVAKANGCGAVSVRANIREVLHAAFPEVKASQGFSTMSLPGILSNVANKFLNEGWMAVDSTWRQISAIRSARNFQTMTSYSLTGGFEYEKVGPAGEIKHGTLGEETYTNKVETYGRMFAITRQAIINDDLDALTAIPRKLGRGAALKLNNVFWTEFLDNSTFFAVGNNNVSTGGGSAFGTDGAGLTAAEVKWSAQTDPDGYPLGIMPAILLVPPTLYNKALQVMNSTSLVTGASATMGSANVFAGRYRVVTSPYMENSNFTGYSAAAWYLLANPSDLPVIETAFLNGRESPTVETAEVDFSSLGVQMRGFHDFGTALQEPRGGVRSAGS